jgi:hypothetical protein
MGSGAPSPQAPWPRRCPPESPLPPTTRIPKALSLADGTSSQALAKGVANAETNSLSYGTATSTSLGVNTYAEADAFSNAKNNSAIDVESDANDSI